MPYARQPERILAVRTVARQGRSEGSNDGGNVNVHTPAAAVALALTGNPAVQIYPLLLLLRVKSRARRISRLLLTRHCCVPRTYRNKRSCFVHAAFMQLHSRH